MMGRIGDKEQGPWMVLSGGRLPVNELILKRSIIKPATEDSVDVTVSPDLTYHSIYSSDIGYTFSNGVKFSLSYLQDDPEEKRPDPDWAIQKIKPIRAYATAVDFSLGQYLYPKLWHFKWSISKSMAGESRILLLTAVLMTSLF